jgi:hypothetical protein
MGRSVAWSRTGSGAGLSGTVPEKSEADLRDVPAGAIEDSSTDLGETSQQLNPRRNGRGAKPTNSFALHRDSRSASASGRDSDSDFW